MPEIAIPKPIPAAMPVPVGMGSPAGSILCLDMQDSGNRIIDSSGYGNHGANSGSIPVTGQYGLARSFDSVDDFINCGKPASLNDISQLSLEVWFKRTGLGGGTVGRHMDKGKWILDCPGSQRMSFQRVFSTTNGYWVSPLNSIVTGRWYHVVLAYDASSAGNTPVFYINGIQAVTSVSVAPVGTASSDAGDSLYIGNNTALTRGFDGQSGIIRIFNRILSAHEALALYRENAWRYGLPA
ncbi:MAG: LamG domain-containing protein [Armatimonadota bacterium]